VIVPDRQAFNCARHSEDSVASVLMPNPVVCNATAFEQLLRQPALEGTSVHTVSDQRITEMPLSGIS
jgi:hypothetical protein